MKVSLLLKFFCQPCKAKEIERCKKLDQDANQGKKFWTDKQQTTMNRDNYVREASELLIISKDSTDYKYPDTDGHGLSGMKCRCVVCGEYTNVWLEVGVTDLL